jgi:hypothetical protein
MGIEVEVGGFGENRFSGTDNSHKGESNVIFPVSKIGVERNGEGSAVESGLIAGTATSFRKARRERGEGGF